ncbi:MAG: 4-hydroxy-tetrahydrodipicolinate synthase [Candidatus Hodarchaeota archaeon]
MESIKGSFVAIITPLDENNNIDFDGFKKLLDFQMKNGTNGLVPMGTTGESATMSHDEHRQVIKFTLDYVKENASKFGRELGKDLIVMPGTGSNSTSEAIGLTKFAKSEGAHAALVISPYYNKPTQEGLKMHFKMIAEAVDIPIMLYNVPGRTGRNVEADTTIELSKISNIVSIKEASGNIGQIMKIIQHTRDTDFRVMSGDDAMTYSIMTAGGYGIVSVAANVVPDKMAKFAAALLNKDYKTALDLHYELLDLFNVQFIETNPGPIKYMANVLGLTNSTIRPPLVLPQPGSQEKIKAVLKKLNML